MPSNISSLRIIKNLENDTNTYEGDFKLFLKMSKSKRKGTGYIFLNKFTVLLSLKYIVAYFLTP